MPARAPVEDPAAIVVDLLVRAQAPEVFSRE